MFTEETKTTKSQTEKDWVLCFNTTQKMVIDEVMDTINHFIESEKSTISKNTKWCDDIQNKILNDEIDNDKGDEMCYPKWEENHIIENTIYILNKLKETMEYSLEDLTCNTFYHYPYDDIDWDND